LSTLAKDGNCGPDLSKEVKEVLRSSGLFLIEEAVEGKSSNIVKGRSKNAIV